MSDGLWEKLRDRAQDDGLTRSFVLAILARDFVKNFLEVRETTSGSEPVRTARISDDVWDALKLEAESQGLAASRVLVALAEDYVEGRVALHVHVTTSQEETEYPSRTYTG